MENSDLEKKYNDPIKKWQDLQRESNEYENKFISRTIERYEELIKISRLLMWVSRLAFIVYAFFILSDWKIIFSVIGGFAAGIFICWVFTRKKREFWKKFSLKIYWEIFNGKDLKDTIMEYEAFKREIRKDDNGY